MSFDPYVFADEVGVEVIHRRIRTANALWIPDHNLIVVRQGMKAAHDRSALAHELGHAMLGHRDDRPKHEVQADRWAADKLINLEECRDLLEWAELSRVASELDVTGRLLRVFLNVHRWDLSAVPRTVEDQPRAEAG